MKAVLKQVRISPKKINLIAGMVRNKQVEDALQLLKFLPKKGADILYKVVASAAANAEKNFKQSKSKLHISEIVVNEGPSYKRSLPCSRGRVHRIIKRTAHVTVKLDVAAVPEVAKEKETA